MPANPTLPVTITANVTTGHATDSQTVHGIINAIYKAPIGTTRTTAYTLAQSNSAEVIPVNSSSAVAITVPSLEAGTTVEIVRLGTGAVTFTASGITFVQPAGSTLAIRAQGCTASLVWLTTTSVLISGDLT